MPKLQIVNEAQVSEQETYPVPASVSGLASAKLISPPDYALWLCRARFRVGGQIEWDEHHGDEGLYLV